MHLDPPARIRLTYTPYPRLIRSLKPLPLFFSLFPCVLFKDLPCSDEEHTTNAHTHAREKTPPLP